MPEAEQVLNVEQDGASHGIALSLGKS